MTFLKYSFQSEFVKEVDTQKWNFFGNPIFFPKSSYRAYDPVTALKKTIFHLTLVFTLSLTTIEEGWRQKLRQNDVVLEWGARLNAALRILV